MQARELVASMGLTDKIRFAGFRKDPEGMIALADVGVLTSLREGLPRVVVQYAAAGLPTVASELPSIEDVVENGVSAIVTPRPTSRRRQAIGRLLADTTERERLAAGARAIDVDAWLLERMNASIDEAYRYCPCVVGTHLTCRRHWSTVTRGFDAHESDLCHGGRRRRT